MSDSGNFTGSYGRPTTGGYRWTCLLDSDVGQQELGLSRDQIAMTWPVASLLLTTKGMKLREENLRTSGPAYVHFLPGFRYIN